MPNSLPPLMEGIATALKHLNERQRVLAGNVANVDTPGFKAQDVERPDFSSLVGQSTGDIAKPQVVATAEMRRLGVSQSVVSVQPDRDISEVKPDGNNVTLEDQLLKLGGVQADYNALTNIYRKNMQLMKLALGRGNN